MDLDPAIHDDPRFRRATLNMKLAYSAARAVLDNHAIDPKRILLVVGTSFGELQSTYDFFAGLVNDGVARPLAFQNSLHHSTLGFLSSSLGIRGPGFTVSDQWWSGENALTLAMDWMSGFAIDHALVIGVDSGVEDLRAPAELRAGVVVSAGAGAVLISRRPLSNLRIDGVTTRITSLPSQPTLQSPHFDSNAISILSFHLEPGSIRLSKPDGTHSLIRLVEA